ncbi:histone deacetylase family protein [Segnochrobactrum spirostomi]|uniref:Histone deacetylase family protein n=1 Tax=Segnochrobactrum spirostomi TaxID=2608987 RepID=A0A6A7Y2W8_9HYPH|nr:histone deacetylase family protein [Segnochrobactrum spirostomi]MQT13096.1 histone deacetylase family protein [Segnochrobactrum spirostomi]
MKLIFDPAQLAHRPTQYMVHGRVVAPLENPDRAATLAAALEPLGLVREALADAGRGPIEAVHAPDYVAFLAEAYARFQALPNAGPEVWPNVHPYRGAGPDLGARGRPRPTGILGRAGFYLGDLSCAMMAGTFEAAYASAQTAIAGADALLAGERAAYALCRPPGHHAYVDRASGFCFFNNAAIAAERLRARFGRVAIADFDTHHGDGTQAIFYTRDDVFYGSVHTDPSAYYPHFAGYADEIGHGAGEGANLNLPLPFGADDAAFLAANERLAQAVAAFGADVLILSAGWDAHRDDPLSRLAVTSAAYERLGRLWGATGLPTLIVQEGGYSLAAIAEAAPAFVAAFRAAAGLAA